MEQISKSLMEVRKQILLCRNCDLCEGCRSPIPLAVSAKKQETSPGNHTLIPTVQFTVLGEAPGRLEDYQGRPFVGPAGQLLRRTLRDCGLDPNDGYYMNVVSCWPHGTPTTIQIKACRDNLKAQLDVVENRWVLCCGNTALKAMVPHATLKNATGKFIPIHGKVLVPVLHPAYLLHKNADKDARDKWVADVAKFTMGMFWGEDDIVNSETRCIYCNKEGWPACKRHMNYWASDSKWKLGEKKSKKTGLQDERLF